MNWREAEMMARSPHLFKCWVCCLAKEEPLDRSVFMGMIGNSKDASYVADRMEEPLAGARRMGEWQVLKELKTLASQDASGVSSSFGWNPLLLTISRQRLFSLEVLYMRECVYVCACVYFSAFNLANLCLLNTNYLLDSDNSAFLKQPQQALPVHKRRAMWLCLCTRPLWMVLG